MQLSIQNTEYRLKVERLEASLLASGENTARELPVTHYFTGNGLYGRSLLIPKGTVATGYIHKHEHIAILLDGEVSVMLESGLQHVTAPMVVVSPPGVKRAVYAHKDSIWFTCHKVVGDTVELVEHELVAKSYEEYLDYTKALALEGN